MFTLFFVYLLLVMCVYGRQYKQVAIIDWKEIDLSITKWFELRPFVIKNSPMTRWKFYKYLQQNSIKSGNERMISYYQQNKDKRFSKIKTELRQTNCCFTNFSDKCKQYVSGFLYNAWQNRLEFWEQYETNYAQIQTFKQCTNTIVTEDIKMENVFNELYSIKRKEKDLKNMKFSLYTNANVPLEMYKSMNKIKSFFDSFHIDATYGDWELYLWIGSENGYANRHYDTTNNLFFILRGSKTFYLSPPSLSEFKVYSSLHNSWRQEMLFTFDDEGYDENIDIYNMEAVLTEGDVLYIPPMWFHKVKNLNDSTIGTNMWWYSQIHQRMNDLWDLSIPIEEDWSVERKMVEMMYFVHRLLDRLGKKLLFISKNYLNMYPILEQITEIVRRTNVFYLDKEWKWLELLIDFESIQKCLDMTQISAIALLNTAYQCSSSSLELTKKWNKSIDSLLASMNALNSDGMRDVLLAEIIEKLLSYCINGNDDDSTLVPLLVTFSTF